MEPSESSNSTDSPLGKPGDKELAVWIRQAAGGSRDHQKRIYELLFPRVFPVIRKIVGVGHVDDVMQDFVIQLFAKLGQFRFESSLESWAHRMAVNHSLQHLRKQSRQLQQLRKVASSTESSNDSMMQQQIEEAELVRLAMEQISNEQRTILHLKEIEGLGYQEIASILEIPEGTVGSRLNKARKELRDSLIRLGWGGQP